MEAGPWKHLQVAQPPSAPAHHSCRDFVHVRVLICLCKGAGVHVSVCVSARV